MVNTSALDARAHFDVAVIGAGPAGSATARRLALAGRRVLLIERSHFEQCRVGESLSPSVQPLLRDLGVWARFEALGPWPSWGTRSAWGLETPEMHSHITSPYGCGWHIDRQAFDRMLADSAVEAGARLCTGTRLSSSQRQGDGLWRLQFAVDEPGPGGQAPTEASARLLIDATGRGAHVGRSMGARRLLFDNLVGVVTRWSGGSAAAQTAPAQNFVLVETAPGGWWYSAPLPGPTMYSSMVGMLFTDADVCGRLDLRDAAGWTEQLRQAPATHERLSASGRRAQWGPRTVSAVSQRLCRAEFDAPWLAVGDAALSVDPISGSGVVRALRTAQSAAETALEALGATDTGGRWSEPLQNYERLRDMECTTYLSERASYYAQERRWDSTPFWWRRTRHAPLEFEVNARDRHF